jgi:dihydroxyacetone kinase
MKKIINSVTNVVLDALEGQLLANPNLKRVAGFNILVRADIEEYKQRNVTLLSGGGSGHEPAHAGFIGDGMLSGAVCGNVFASPSVAAILTAIQLCAGPKGLLVIIKNYTGDRLNFGMAIERARLQGIKVMMVIVADDCALPIGKGITGGRGVAGTVFVHKIAGAVAANSASTLDDVVNAADRVINTIGTMGIALSVCCVPGALPSNRLDDPALIEVGLGIHGEPGREQRSIPTSSAAKELAEVMIESIVGESGRLTVDARNEEVCLLLNNLGGLSVLELNICAREVLSNLRLRGIGVHSAHIGSFMTAMNMNGVSLSLLKLNRTDADSKLHLASPTSCVSWVPSYSLEALNASSGVFDYLQSRLINPLTSVNSCTDSRIRVSAYVHKIITAVCGTLILSEPRLTEYDTICGDGDCGLSISAGVRFLLEHLDPAADENDSEIQQWGTLFSALADCVSVSMGGTLGAITEILFRAMAVSHTEENSNWARALEKGVEAVKFYGGASVGMRTMLDALSPAVDVIRTAGAASVAAALPKDLLLAAVQAAKEGAEATKLMTALAGRANYVSEELTRGTPDPGAMAVYIVLAALSEAM